MRPVVGRLGPGSQQLYYRLFIARLDGKSAHAALRKRLHNCFDDASRDEHLSYAVSVLPSADSKERWKLHLHGRRASPANDFLPRSPASPKHKEANRTR